MTTTLRGRAAALLGAIVMAFVGTFVLATPAHAASGDAIDSITGTYTVKSDGSLDVDETYVYRFGAGSGRHGMIRYITTREVYQNSSDQDRVYDVTKINVTSPDSGVSTKVATSTVDATGGEKGRAQQLKIQVGDAKQTVKSETATYRFRYNVSRVVIHPDNNGDQFYADPVTGQQAPIAKATFTVTTPTDITKLNCGVGAQGTKNATSGCEVSGTGNSRVISVANVGNGTGVSLAAIFSSGAVNPNTPELVAKGSPQVTSDFKRILALIGGGTALTTIAAVVGGLIYGRTRGRDKRYIGVPPGLLPGPGQQGHVGTDNKPEIPVQFNPPPISVGEAGMLDDGTVDVRDTTATLVDLAVRGFVQIAQTEDKQTLVRAITDKAPELRHEIDLMQAIFNGPPQRGMEVVLGAGGEMAAAHQYVTNDLTGAMEARGWYTRMPHGIARSPFRSMMGCLWPLFFVVISAGGLGVILSNAIFALPLVPLIILAIWMASRARGGQRSADGRAMADQIVGFRKYIATAEANQLKFEEGEDIFSKYLPWAVMFGLAERWTKVCAELVQLGRIPDTSPDWYYGYWPGFFYFDMGGIGHSMDNSFEPAGSGASGPSSFDSGSGSGFSGFDSVDIGGGGFSGGSDSW